MTTPQAAAQLDQYRQAAWLDAAALSGDRVTGDPYEKRLIARNKELSAKYLRTGRLTRREAIEQDQNNTLLLAFQELEDPDHLELRERTKAGAHSHELPTGQALRVLAFDEARSRQVREGKAA